MSHILEITGNDIAQLNDSDLRVLVGMLCEADYRTLGLSTRGVLYGGHQDAPDGGLDVVVQDVFPPVNSHVPRIPTGFQVKKKNMPRSEIIKEMRPNGKLRESIKDLIKEKGAYIIISSQDSTTNETVRNRISAMRESLKGVRNAKCLEIDFYDQSRIASWVRGHYSMILWVRERIGKRINGWYPYDNWANTPGGTNEEYLIDDQIRLYDETRQDDKAISIEEGIGRLRRMLSISNKSIRLVGLSGVGKTRLVQALFDERIGENSLNKSKVFYTDISYEPNPSPQELAELLIADKEKGVLIVDNCSKKLHNELTKICTKRESTISLLTIEYDVRDDLPEETEVFRLEPASVELIAKLILRRYDNINQTNSFKIAEFAGGNARLAIALANTIRKGESLSDFSDAELFERLFWQRHQVDKELLLSAEICSLVYSFEGTDTESENSELKFLASLAGRRVSELYSDVTELKRRELVQSRSKWRALLPHALANYLAKRVLESISTDKILRYFHTKASDRLIKSFAHRISYLHDCKEAIEIVKNWLAPNGWLGKENCKLNYFGIEIVRYIVPICPKETLEMIERAAHSEGDQLFVSSENTHYSSFVLILKQIAYDSVLFNRSVNLLIKFALTIESEETRNSSMDELKITFLY